MSHEDFKFYTIQIVHFLHLTSVHAGCVSVVTCLTVRLERVLVINQKRSCTTYMYFGWSINSTYLCIDLCI